MDVVTGVRVQCADSPCGRSRYVILDPAKATITHLVVGGPDTFARTRLVPFVYVSESTPELIRLQLTRAELDALPLFSEYEYVEPEDVPMVYSPSELRMGPLATYWPIRLPKERQHVPEGEQSIRRGAAVVATDGRVGSVDGFLVEPASGHIMHLILRWGHLWGRREITIPVSEIDRIEQDTVYLRINKERVGGLASYRREAAGASSEPLLKALATKPDTPVLRRGAHHVLRLCTGENLKKETAPVLTALEGIEAELEVPVAARRALAALQG